MKKILVIAIVCLLGSFAAAAQTVKVNGTIVDEQNRPVEFVNVALISLPDSSFVTGSTTDGKGKFALRATAGSDFLLRLSISVTSANRLSSGLPKALCRWETLS